MKSRNGDASYDLVKREKVKSGVIIKSLLRALFSHIGLVVSSVAIAIFGKHFYK